MYGVFWMTPPHSPVSTVASASVRSTSRVRYSSPAAIALSVLSMPPMIVTSANGTAIDRYGSASCTPSSHASVGHGMARRQSARRWLAARGPPPSAARAQKIAAPTSTAANAPGTPSGIRTPPRRTSSSTTRATRPTRGSRRTFSIGRNAISNMATPAIEPRSAARGTTRRTQSPANDSATLASPMAIVTAMPTFQASTGSPVASFTGPSTPKTMAKSVGVSMPKGIAVTSVRPVRRMRRTAMNV